VLWLLAGIVAWFVWLDREDDLDLGVIFVPPVYGLMLGWLISRLPVAQRVRYPVVATLGAVGLFWLWWLLPLWFGD
jgi:hypothetical protein